MLLLLLFSLLDQVVLDGVATVELRELIGEQDCALLVISVVQVTDLFGKLLIVHYMKTNILQCSGDTLFGKPGKTVPPDSDRQ